MTYHQQKAAEFVAEAARLKSPTTGEFACRLWEWSTRNDVPVHLAGDTLRRCGYEPFSGFPLTRRK